MIKRFIEYISGYLMITADGCFPERFINICIRRGLGLRDIRKMGKERIYAKIGIDGFLKIRPVAKRTSMHVKIKQRCGLPFLVHNYRRRAPALIGVVIAAAFLWYTSHYVMGIDVFGNERVPSDRIISELEQLGLTRGVKAADIDQRLLSNKLLTLDEDLAWVGININGSRVFAEVAERIEKPQKLDKSQPCNLIASKDGVIEHMEIRDGQTMIKRGEAVTEGQVLASGIMDNAKFGYTMVHARGDVYAVTKTVIRREYDLEGDVRAQYDGARGELEMEFRRSLPEDAKIRSIDCSYSVNEFGKMEVVLTGECSENIAVEAPIEIDKSDSLDYDGTNEEKE